MHLANQSSRKLDKLFQGSSKLDKLSHSSMGDTLDVREATGFRERSRDRERAGETILRSNPVNPEKQSRGEC